MPFLHALKPASDASGASCAFVLAAPDRQLARIQPDGAIALPVIEDIRIWLGARDQALYLGELDTASCWLAAVEGEPPAPPAGWEWHDTRMLLGGMTAAQAQAMACARQLHWWRTRHRFCGACGTAMVDAAEERVRRCPRCAATYFPSASPAVIVAVTRDDRLLLAHNRHFRAGMFSLLAGFVDPGETLERAVVREVREETAIEIRNLRYVRSQPWPFPNSLMAGFRAEHASGEIVEDGQEIEQAAWFTRDALPSIPRPGTVARELIDAWLREG